MRAAVAAALALAATSEAFTKPPRHNKDVANALQKIEGMVAKRMQAKGDKLRADIASGAAAGAPVITTKYGTINGITMEEGAVNAYLGVPFAEQPIGDLRWKNPVPPNPWGAFNATWYGPACIQPGKTWGILSGFSEACLNLNVYVPTAAPPAGGFPVMAFLYGGSWVYGSNSFPLYDAAHMVALTQDTIVVTINYRLNVFGFLAGDALKAESPDGSVGNYGLADQRAGLQFIQDTITNFGGDPTRVMLFGESAGAGSTTVHLVSQKSWGLFSRALTESTLFPQWSSQPYSIAKLRLAEIASNVGCSTAPDVLACMRAVPEATLLASDRGGVTQGFQEWSPVIDGVELTDFPINLMLQGKVAPVPIAGGFNMNEGTLFTHFPTDLPASDFQAAIASELGTTLAAQVASMYNVSDYPSTWWALSAVMGDGTMICPAQAAARALTDPKVRSGHPVYLYYFTHVYSLIQIVDDFKPLGCFHGSELLCVFDALELLLYGPGEKDLAHQFVRYWTRFAATGNPNGGGDPQWLEFGASGGNVAILDTGATGGVNVTNVPSVKDNLCVFWDSVFIQPCALWGGCASALPPPPSTVGKLRGASIA